jgi:ATP-dependent RNA helicase DDX49/DBP8
MARDDSDFSASDEDILQHQAGSRKRRRLSPTAEPDVELNTESDPEPEPAQTRIPVSTISRIKAKHQTPTAASPVPATLPSTTEKLSFASIDVAPWLVASLASMEIKKPTGIQAACIPEILKGRDCIGGSRTGTGKTVAFSVPILQKWAEDPVGIFGLVVT